MGVKPQARLSPKAHGGPAGSPVLQVLMPQPMSCHTPCVSPTVSAWPPSGRKCNSPGCSRRPFDMCITPGAAITSDGRTTDGGSLRGGWCSARPSAPESSEAVGLAGSWRARVSCSGRFSQQSQSVEDYQQARAHVGEDGHPHRGVAEDGEREEDGFDAKRQRDVLPENGVYAL